MKNLIALNFAVGFLLAACCVAGEVVFVCFLPLIILLPSLFLLAPVNLASIFIFWKENRFRAFIPVSTYVLAVAIFLFGISWGADFVLRGTPCSPETFFTEHTKSELTGIADRLLLDYRESKKYQYPPEIPLELGVKLNEFKLSPVSIDRKQQIVAIGLYHDYHHYNYYYIKNGPTNLPQEMKGDPDLKNLGDNWYFRYW